MSTEPEIPISVCDDCSREIHLADPQVYALYNNTVAVLHVACFDASYDNAAHFVWPPADESQNNAYRLFAALLQEAVKMLPNPLTLTCCECKKEFLVDTAGHGDDLREELMKLKGPTCTECQAPNIPIAEAVDTA